MALEYSKAKSSGISADHPPKNATNSYADFFSLSQFACLGPSPQNSYPNSEVKSACEKVHASDWNVHVVTQFC